MFAWFLEDTLVAGVLALLVAGAVRFLSLRPATAHLLWLATLGVLLMPRLPWIATPGAELREGLRGWLGASTAPSGSASIAAPYVPDALDPLRFGGADLDGAAASSVGRASIPRAAWIPALGSIESAALLVWLGGALIVLVRSARRILPFQRLVKRSPLAPRALRREVLDVARRLGVRAPEARLVAGVASPSVWCLGPPRLLWPATGTADARRARSTLIAHELAHLARRDHWVSWLELPAAALSWWNPLFWWIRGHIRHYAELSCDAWAVWAYPADRRAFAEALIDMQARTRTASVALQGLGATDSECKNFERRLDMIMQKGKFPGVSKGAALLAMVTAVLASPGFTEGKKGGDTKASTACASGSSAVVESRARGVELARKAKELLAAKQNEAALAALQEVVALDPENGWAHGRIGYLEIGAGQLDAARKSFQRQYELGYERANALYNSGCALALARDEHLAREYIAAAVCHGFADADLMAKDPDLASIRADAGFQEWIRKARMIVELREALAQHEKDGDGQGFLAMHAQLSEILAADGKLQSEHGHMALKAGDFEGAARAFARQAEAGHDVATAYYNRACALARGGDTEGAMSDLRTAAERGMNYSGVTKDTDLDRLRDLPGFAQLQARILTAAEANEKLKALLNSQNGADAAALTALVEDSSQSNKVRALAAQALGRFQLREARYAEAYETFEGAAELGVEVRLSAFGMAQALAGAGKESEALRHVELALDLGFADPDALGKFLETNALASPAGAETMIGRAEKARAAKAAYGEKEKAWAAGMKAKPKAYGEKVAQDS